MNSMPKLEKLEWTKALEQLQLRRSKKERRSLTEFVRQVHEPNEPPLPVGKARPFWWANQMRPHRSTRAIGEVGFLVGHATRDIPIQQARFKRTRRRRRKRRLIFDLKFQRSADFQCTPKRSGAPLRDVRICSTPSPQECRFRPQPQHGRISSNFSSHCCSSRALKRTSIDLAELCAFPILPNPSPRRRGGG
jgi:hypothetical protein